MIPLNENGEIDVKFVERLPFEDFDELAAEMNWDQMNYFFSLAQPAEGEVKPLETDYSLEDFIDWGWGVDMEKIIARMREEI